MTPLVSGFISKHLSGAKFSSSSNRLAAIKSENIDYTAKVAPGPVLPSTAIGSSAEKDKSACTGSCERSTKSEAREFRKVCALMKTNLLEDIDACAKFVDSVGKVFIRSDSFAKCLAYLRRSSLIVTMHKTLILATEFMHVDKNAVKYAKKAEVALMA
ncbi:hypothetical protein PS1_012547 [Malus domestica]